MKRPILDETFMEDVLDGIGACIRGFAESKAKRLPGAAAFEIRTPWRTVRVTVEALKPGDAP